jgi:peptide deformylase
MIITNDEAALRVKCEDVTKQEVNELISILETELSNANKLGKGGIGLAAPQIGIAKKIAIIRLPNISLNLVNCHIEKGYDPLLFKEEGCLSFPGRLEDTIRFQEVHIVNNLVEPYNFIAEGFIAVACQHELDHVNSTLFMDHKVLKVEPKKKKLGPNDICNCGSQKKYKKCCGKAL